MADDETVDAAAAEASSSAEVKQDVKPDAAAKSEISAVDEKGVPWMNRAKELEKRYQGVDPDKYREWERKQQEQTSSEEDTAEEEEPSPDKAEDDEDKPLTVRQFKAWQQEQSTRSWMRKYDSAVTNGLENIVKDETSGLKELSPLEKKFVSRMVDEEFEKDATLPLKQRKLTLQSIPSKIQEAVKAVKEHRAWVRSQGVQKDGTPDPIHGQTPQGMPKKGIPEDAGERVGAMLKDFNEMRAQSSTGI